MIDLLLAFALSLTMPMEVTAYSLACAGCSGIAANGRPPVLGVSIACPRSLPLGTRLHLEGLGERICHDRGGAITKGRLDLFVESKRAAFRWGRRTVNVKVVR